MAVKIALAGNPNCGKTTLFNALTGSNQFVGNWPGVTVEKKEGKLKGHKDVVIMDLPGIYSLSPYTLEEVVARNYLIAERPDAILNIVDGTNIERNLYLSTQLMELGIPVIMAVNMMDVVEKSGEKIHTDKLSKKLGCEVVELFSEPDGTFPNHHPNPSVEKTLDTLKATVIKENADIGIAYDGDSDRIGVVDNCGRYLTGDKLLLVYAEELVKKCKKDNVIPTVVSEVKCSQVLFDTIDKIGGHSVMCKTGHGYIKAKMRETGAILAGEMSGHTFFKDRYFGFDDAIYAGCRIIEIIAENKQNNPNFTIGDLLKPFDEVYSSPELRYPCPNELKKSTLDAISKKIDSDKNVFGTEIKDIITLDGMRVVFDGGFALIRQSNTEPVFTLRFEARTKEECEKLQNAMTGMLDSILKTTVK